MNHIINVSEIFMLTTVDEVMLTILVLLLCLYLVSIAKENQNQFFFLLN